jgi:phage-related minor tail protein
MDDWQDGFAAFQSEAGGMRRDVAALRAEMGGPLVADAERAGAAIERALLRAVTQGKFGFEDLKRSALAAMNEIARGAIRGGIGAIFGGGGGGSGGGGLLGTATSLALAAFGAPGRAAGGPVAGGRAYMVGERGPELFVPTSAGRVEAGGAGARHVSITVNMQGAAGADPQRMAQSGRQLAQAVRRAMMQGEA